jgi:hypothetical protein
MRMFTSVVAILCTFVVAAAAAAPGAQAPSDHAVDQSTLDAAVRQHVGADAQEREAVVRVLGHPEVRAQAERFGIDLREASTAVGTLDAADLRAVSSQAAHVEQALAGGQSKVVISTTTIIIALLVLILLIVALR